MSRDAKIAIAGTVCGLAWSVTSAWAIEQAVPRAVLVGIAIAMPLVAWLLAWRLRPLDAAASDRLLVDAFVVEFWVMFVVDLSRWALRS
jgi:hypothetical protein